VVLEAKTALQLLNTLAANYGSYKIWQSAIKHTRKIKNNRLEAILNEQEPGREKYRNNITYRTLRFSL
jgi:3'-phosphoadenosine 5'-phosphosulfate sulfotransferase